MKSGLKKRKKRKKKSGKSIRKKHIKKRKKIITFLKENKGKSFKKSEISSRAFGFFDFLEVDHDTDKMIERLADDKNSPVHRIYKEGYFLFLFDNSDYYYYYKD